MKEAAVAYGLPPVIDAKLAHQCYILCQITFSHAICALSDELHPNNQRRRKRKKEKKYIKSNICSIKEYRIILPLLENTEEQTTENAQGGFRF